MGDNMYSIINDNINLNILFSNKANSISIKTEYKSIDTRFILDISIAIIRASYRYYSERTNSTPFQTIVSYNNQMLLDIIYSSMKLYAYYPLLIKDFFFERLYAHQILFQGQQNGNQYNLSPIEVRINNEVKCHMECITDFSLSRSLLKVENVKLITRLHLHNYEKTPYHITVIPSIQGLIDSKGDWLCINDNTIEELRSEINPERLKKISYIINRRIEREELNDVMMKSGFTPMERDITMYHAKVKSYTDYISWNFPDIYTNGNNLNKNLLIKQHYMTEEQFIKYAKFHDLSVSPRTLLNYIQYSIFPEPEKDQTDKNKKYYNPAWIKYLKRITELKPKLKLGIRNSHMENIRRKDEAFFKDIHIRQNNIKK